MGTPSMATLVIMAAGMGSRYGGLKQIEAVGPSGEIVIHYSIYDAVRAGFGRVVFVVRRDIRDAVRAAVEPHVPRGIPVQYVCQDLADLPAGFAPPPGRTKPWGTVHAVWACREAVGEPFAVVNADDFYGPQSFRVVAEALKEAGPERRAWLVGFRLRHTLSDHGPVTRALCRVAPDGLLAGIAEIAQIEREGAAARYRDGEAWKPLAGDEVVSMNLWGFPPSVFALLEEELAAFLRGAREDARAELPLPTAVGQWLARRALTVRMVYSEEPWMGVTYPEDKRRVAEGIRGRIRAGQYPAHLR